MSFAPPGTLARRRQQASLDDVCVKMKNCKHAKKPVCRSKSNTLLEYTCPDCSMVRATFQRSKSGWVRTR